MLKKLLALSLIVTTVAISCLAVAQDQGEYAVKAAYIYNFAKFVQFPANSVGSKFVIGVLGDNPFEDELNAEFDGKQVGGRRVVIKRLDSLQALRSCNVVYISPSEDQRIDDIVAILKGQPILTIADSSGYISKGVMINMTVENNRVRFDVNLSSSRTAGLEISSRLLSLARGVVK
jgi:hypothetical protein